MSRYKITLKPQGAIPQDVDIAIKLPPPAVAASESAPAPGFCIPNPGVLRMWDGEAWTLTERTEFAQFGGNPIYMKLLGTLCEQPVEWVITSDDGWALSDMSLVDGAILVFDAGNRSPTTITWEARFQGKSCGEVKLMIVYG